jgi:hypothetical protein
MLGEWEQASSILFASVEIRMPIRGSRDPWVGAPAIVVNPRHGPVGSQPRFLPHRHLGKQAQRRRHAADHALNVLDAGPACLRHVLMQDSKDRFRVPVVVSEQYKDQDGNAEADE